MAEKDLTKFSDKELEAESSRLAEERTKVRLAQNAVADELSARKMLEGLSEGAKRTLQLKLGGEISSAGEGAPK